MRLLVAAACLAVATVALAEEKPLTDDEARDLATKIEAAIQRRDSSVLEASFDREAFIARGIKGLEAASDSRGFGKGFANATHPGAETVNAIGSKGRYKLVGVLECDGELTAVYRMNPASGGFAFHEYRLGRGSDGRAKVVDIFFHTNGIAHSGLLRNGLIGWLVKKGDPAVANLGALGKGDATTNDRLKELNDHETAHEWAKALATWRMLPKAIAEARPQMARRWRCANNLGGEEQASAADDLVRLYGKDSLMAQNVYDAQLVTGKYDDALASIDRLEARVGKDAYLEYQRAEVLRLAKKPVEDQKKAARASAELDPALPSPWWFQVTVSLDEKEYAETVRLLTHLETKLDYVLKDLTKIEVYSGFVKSKEYEAWMASRKPR